MSKHTPRPWIATVQPGQVVGVHTYTHQVMYGDDCIASLLTEADARLIAAAPDLLEACKAAVDAGLIPELDSLPTKTRTRAGDAATQIRAAIAKAEGWAESENQNYCQTTAPVTVTCNVCGRFVGKRKPVFLFREQVDSFRGNDLMHWRCPKCRAIAKAVGGGK